MNFHRYVTMFSEDSIIKLSNFSNLNLILLGSFQIWQVSYKFLIMEGCNTKIQKFGTKIKRYLIF